MNSAQHGTRDLPTVSALVGRRVRLVPVVPAHHRRLYEISVSGDNLFRWRYHGVSPSFESFERSLYNGVLCQFAVLKKDKQTKSHQDDVVGLVVAYNADLRNGHCYIAAVRDTSLSIGILEALSLFVSHVFCHWPLRKMYLEVAEYNVGQFASAVRRKIITEEGRLRNHYYLNDDYWDHVMYALYRGDPKTRLELLSYVEDGRKMEPRVQ